jgi:hypothetical protein
VKALGDTFHEGFGGVGGGGKCLEFLQEFSMRRRHVVPSDVGRLVGNEKFVLLDKQFTEAELVEATSLSGK